jgi:predicted kinase
MLIVFSGLPGAGKSPLARALARELDAVYLRIDTIEEALLTSGGKSLVDAGAGYRIAYDIAEDNLRLGRKVIADCVNPIALTRNAWRAVAARAGVICVDVAVVCSDQDLHKRRIADRAAGTRWSNWQEVTRRTFDPVDPKAIVLDTATQSVEQNVASFLSALGPLA